MSNSMKLFFNVWLVAALVSHIAWCMRNQEYFFAITGTLLFPVGWVVGTGTWFGAW